VRLLKPNGAVRPPTRAKASVGLVPQSVPSAVGQRIVLAHPAAAAAAAWAASLVFSHITEFKVDAAAPIVSLVFRARHE